MEKTFPTPAWAVCKEHHLEMVGSQLHLFTDQVFYLQNPLNGKYEKDFKAIITHTSSILRDRRFLVRIFSEIDI